MIVGARDHASDRTGLTLVEVVIAVAILAIGILAALAMQSTALQSTRRMTVAQAFTKIAFTELDFQRSVFTTTSAPAPGSCVGRLTGADAASGFECEVVVTDCVVTESAANCPPASGVPNAFLVDVIVGRPNDGSLTLRRVLGERVYFEEESMP